MMAISAAIGALDHFVFIEQQCAPGIDGEGGGTGFEHGFDGSQAGDGDIEQQVRASTRSLDEAQRFAIA